MTAVIQFTPLCGVGAEEPFCYLLQIDDTHILLDCGWTEQFDEEQLRPLKQVIDKIDAVIISHPDLAHLGALPYAVGKLGLTAPIYATVPIWKMGQMFLYDAFQTKAQFKFDTFSLDDVDTAFEGMKQLKYKQDVVLPDKGGGEIRLTPYAAGHMLGGTVWKITKETEEIIYAVEFNHAKERHLNAMVLDSISTRPSVLITDAFGALRQPKLRKDRDTELRDTTFKTIRAGGNVLVPCDAAGRVLELLVLMNGFWAGQKGLQGNYTLAFLSPVSFNTVDFARGQIEWMSDLCMKQFDNARSNPLSFKDLHVVHTKADFDALKQPFVCFATSATLETSFAQVGHASLLQPATVTNVTTTIILHSL
jgi:cleavage and polyadenylation specificity factor subunit 2